MSKKLIILFLVALSFLSGFAYRHSRPSYLFYLRDQFEKYFQPKNISLEKYTSSCPEKITQLPSDSILIIGHAYGSPKYSDLRGNKKIAPKVYDFYSKNQQNIEAIIFSGDVLKEPSAKKWKNFYADFDESDSSIQKKKWFTKGATVSGWAGYIFSRFWETCHFTVPSTVNFRLQFF